MKKKITFIDFEIPKLRTPETWSYKCLKIPVLEDPSTSNTVNVPKHCWNQHHSTFSILIYQCQVNWVGKSLFYWHAKSWGRFLTHWLPIKSILFLIETISRYQFICNYLRKKIFSLFFYAFFKCKLNFQYFEKKDVPRRFWNSEITDSGNVVI